MKIKLWINDKLYEPEIEADSILLNVLRSLGFKSVKCGCDTTNCGLCTVILEKKSVLSCSIPAARAEGKHIYTLEAFREKALQIGGFLADEGADQCGFCGPGFIMNVISMEMELENPSEEEIKKYLIGNLCRCTGYMSQHRALIKYFASKYPYERKEADL